jgi:hypothetical protein
MVLARIRVQAGGGARIVLPEKLAMGRVGFIRKKRKGSLIRLVRYLILI